jgi:hypothetical protein
MATKQLRALLYVETSTKYHQKLVKMETELMGSDVEETARASFLVGIAQAHLDWTTVLSNVEME